MPKLYKEKQVKTFQEIIDYVDNSPSIDKPLSSFLGSSQKIETLTFNGTEIDVLKIVQKYQLQYDEYRSRMSYKDYMRFPQDTPNTYSAGPCSMFGHIPYKLNVRGHGINIIKNLKTNYEHCYASKIANSLNSNEAYVIYE